MKTLLMAIAIVRKNDSLLLRKTDPDRNPYQQPWALFGGKIEGDGDITTLLNKELEERWSFTVIIDERLWWDEDIKLDHDGEEKRFVYIDALCRVESGEPSPLNPNEELKWVKISDLGNYELNPPTQNVLNRLNYV
ncbi:NUDIX domain-containing protein [Candidatus Nomurabacteria bacterium]|mgnify:CR=1 FL=1|nr:NUDIX domain-containing protein [Candidatus Nomurabacteria bacterium]